MLDSDLLIEELESDRYAAGTQRPHFTDKLPVAAWN